MEKRVKGGAREGEGGKGKAGRERKVGGEISERGMGGRESKKMEGEKD